MPYPSHGVLGTASVATESALLRNFVQLHNGGSLRDLSLICPTLCRWRHQYPSQNSASVVSACPYRDCMAGIAGISLIN